MSESVVTETLAQQVRDAYAALLIDQQSRRAGCPPLLPGLEPMRVELPTDLVAVSGRYLTRYGVPERGVLLVAGWVDRLLHEHGVSHEHEWVEGWP